MALYPSLEDMKVDQILRQETAATQQPNAPPYPTQSFSNTLYPSTQTPSLSSASLQLMYPHLNDYMGLDLTSYELSLLQQQQEEMQGLMMEQQRAMQPIATYNNTQMIAPISGNSIGLQRATVTHGIRELIVCKDKENRIGLRVKSMHGGVFVVLVSDKSPAALAGLRFGDQLLQIDGEDVAGQSMDQVHKRLRQANSKKISLVVRDRPFERTVTLHKGEGGIVGFEFRDGKVVSIVAGSSAARNGMLTDHHVIEVNGVNVVGLGDSNIREIIRTSDTVVTFTLMPSNWFAN